MIPNAQNYGRNYWTGVLNFLVGPVDTKASGTNRCKDGGKDVYIYDFDIGTRWPALPKETNIKVSSETKLFYFISLDPTPGSGFDGMKSEFELKYSISCPKDDAVCLSELTKIPSSVTIP